MTRKRRSGTTGTEISAAFTVAAWISLVFYRFGAPWAPFLPAWVLLGTLGLIMGLASTFIERTPAALAAAAAGAPAPLAVAWYMSHTDAS